MINELEKKLNSKTKGVIPVHMAGLSCDMETINKFCKTNNLILIEDCAHAIGTKYKGRHVGSFGITGCFSFCPTKQITTEGGVVISNPQSIIDKIIKLKAFGIDTPPELRSKPGVYDVQDLGYNYRMTDFQAALGACQMERYENNLKKRKNNAKLYCELLGEVNGLSFPNYSEDNSYFLFQIILDEHIDRDNVLMALKEKGIGVSIHYATPVPLMSYYKNKYAYKSVGFPNALRYGNSVISLPVHSNLKSSEIKYICKSLKIILKKQ